MGASLLDLAARYDEHDFVGRVAELAVIDRHIDADEGHVILVHGPGGIGKSAFLREVERRAERAGRPVVTIDLRDATPSPQSLTPVLNAVGLSRPVVILDTFEHVAALGQHLRDDLLGALPLETLVVIASREQPAIAWQATAWSRVTTHITLGPLEVPEATELLSRHGLVDERAVQQILIWSGGSPLGLVLGAEKPTGSNDDSLLPPEDLAAALVQRLLDTESDATTMRTQALALASIVRVTTPQLLRTIFNDRVAADDAWAWLRHRSFLTPTGDGIAPHELLARALRAQVRAGSPQLEGRLRRSVVDAMTADALAGGSTAVADLVHLVDSPAIRWGFGVNASTHHLDRLRARDVAVIRASTSQRLAPYLPLIDPWLEHEPGAFYAIRGIDGTIAGIGLAFNSRKASERACTDPFVGPRIAHARANFDGDVVVWHSHTTFDEDPTGAVQGLIGVGGYEYTGTTNPLASYVTVTPTRAAAVAFVTAVGAVREVALDCALSDGSAMEVHILDHGAGGLVESIRANVYGELGLSPDDLAPPEPIVGGLAAGQIVGVEYVRTALRTLESDRGLSTCALASCLLPPDGSIVARGEALRRLLLRAIDRSWPDPSSDERMALAQSYALASPVPSRELHLSRASWFRLLRRALDGVVDQLNDTSLATVSETSQPE